MDISLWNKYAVICGSSGGIGLATARELALNGANCILIARNPEKMQEAVNQLAVNNHQHHSWVMADFSDTSQVEASIKNTVAKHRVDILINNTGGP